MLLDREGELLFKRSVSTEVGRTDSFRDRDAKSNREVGHEMDSVPFPRANSSRSAFRDRDAKSNREVGHEMDSVLPPCAN